MSEDGICRLGADTLDRLDRGAAGVAFNKAIEQAVVDCLDRPGDDRARTVTLQLVLKPVKEVHDNTISCEGARGVYKVRCKRPDYESQELDFGVRTNGMLVFSENSPANHKQPTFFDGGDEDVD